MYNSLNICISRVYVTNGYPSEKMGSFVKCLKYFYIFIHFFIVLYIYTVPFFFQLLYWSTNSGRERTMRTFMKQNQSTNKKKYWYGYHKLFIRPPQKLTISEQHCVQQSLTSSFFFCAKKSTVQFFFKILIYCCLKKDTLPMMRTMTNRKLG